MLKHVLNALVRLCSGMSLASALKMGCALGWFFGQVVRHRRGYVVTTLRRCFPEKSGTEIERIADGVYRMLALNMVEIGRIAGGKADELTARIAVEGEAHVQEALKRKKGVIILTAHLGNWDLLGMFTSIRGYKLNVITKKIKSAAIDELWNRTRMGHGIKLWPAHNSYRAGLKALRQNELLGFMLDQNRPPGQNVFVDFFGMKASTSPGLAVMAMQSKAPIVPVFMHREGLNRHVLRALPLIEPPPDREEATVLAATQLYTRIIEDEIRRYPDQWLWIHRRWKARPPA